jgi:hypothetical protein
MNQTEIERLVIDALTADAENAMKTTNDTEQLQTFLETTRQDTRRRRRLVVSVAVAAAAVAALAFVVWPRTDPDAGTPAGPPDRSGQTSEAEQTATDFFEALTVFDRDAAASYAASGVALTLPSVLEEGSVVDWTLRNRWDEATGWTVTDLAGCQERPGGSAAQVEVACSFTAHQLGSDRLGRGPFGDNTLTVTVRDGAVVATRMDAAFNSNGFAATMWEPFWAWMDQAHPSEAALLAAFEDPNARAARVERSLRLWETRTGQYVAAVEAGDAE